MKIVSIDSVDIGIKFKSTSPFLTDEFMFVRTVTGGKMLLNLTRLRVSDVWLVVPVVLI